MFEKKCDGNREQMKMFPWLQVEHRMNSKLTIVGLKIYHSMVPQTLIIKWKVFRVSIVLVPI